MVWQKGQSGNPKGREKGTENEITKLRADFLKAWYEGKCYERLLEYIKDPNDRKSFFKFVHLIFDLVPKPKQEIDLDLNGKITVIPSVRLQDGSRACYQVGDNSAAIPEIEAVETKVDAKDGDL